MCARSRLSRRGRRFLPLTQTHQQGNKGEERAAAAAPHNAGALLSMTCDGDGFLPSPALLTAPTLPFWGHGGTPEPELGTPRLSSSRGSRCYKLVLPVQDQPVPPRCLSRCCSFGVVAPQNLPCPWGEVRATGRSPSRQLLRQPRGSRFSWGHPLGSPSCCAHSQGPWAPPGGFWVQGLRGEPRARLEPPRAHRGERRVWGSGAGRL